VKEKLMKQCIGERNGSSSATHSVLPLYITISRVNEYKCYVGLGFVLYDTAFSSCPRFTSRLDAREYNKRAPKWENVSHAKEREWRRRQDMRRMREFHSEAAARFWHF